MSTRSLKLCACCIFLSALLGCAETAYEFFPTSEENVDVIDDGDGDGDDVAIDCSDPEAADSAECLGEDPDDTYWEDAGEVQDELPGDDCRSARNPGLDVVRISVANEDLCVTRGAEMIISSTTNYFTTLEPCAENAGQMWTIGVGPALAWEIRNDSVNMNLDILYADPAPGTPVVLYRAHDLPNQRFTQIRHSDGSFSLAPRLTMGLCITKVESSLENLPCDDSPEQRFELLSCR